MSRTVPAANRALDILELFLDHPRLSAGEVINHLGLPRTTVHELLHTLVERRYLVHLPGQPSRYRLGVRVFQLGNVFAQSVDLAREAHEEASLVAAECDETVHVAVLDGPDVIYIARVDSTQAVRVLSAIGRRLPAHCTGVGKMLLSDLSSDAFDALFPRGKPLTTMTPTSISSATRLKAVLQEVRERGLAFDDGESTPDVRCVAAGVRDHTGAMVAAMSVTVPISRWPEATRADLERLVSAGAARLSETLGYRPS